MTYPRFLPLGDAALTVEFGDIISSGLMAQVRTLDAALTKMVINGLSEIVPTYRSLTIHYDPLTLSHNDLETHVKNALTSSIANEQAGTHWQVPVCYDGDHALDREEYAAAVNLPFERIKTLHQKTVFTIAMFGFMPGCAYLSGLPNELHIPRRATPRPRVPEGSIIIGGAQAMLASIPMPTGWYMIGQTPVSIFDPNQDPVTPFNVGDKISFKAIDKSDWDIARIEKLDSQG